MAEIDRTAEPLLATIDGNATSSDSRARAGERWHVCRRPWDQTV